jgi:predicted nuclease with TOPRIM domain
MDTDKLVLAYIRLRDARSDLKRKFEEEDGELLKKMDMIEAELLEHAKEHGLESMKTRFGTASKRMSTRYWAPDWDAFKNFFETVGEDGMNFVEQRIHQSRFKEYLENNPDVAPPVNADSRYKIVVTRSRSS